MAAEFLERFVCRSCGQVCRPSGDKKVWPRVCPACGEGGSSRNWYDHFTVASVRHRPWPRFGRRRWEYATELQLNDTADLYYRLREERRLVRTWLWRMLVVGILLGAVLALGLSLLLHLDFA